MNVKQILKNILSLILILSLTSNGIVYVASASTSDENLEAPVEQMQDQPQVEIEDTQVPQGENPQQENQDQPMEPIAPITYTITWVYFNGASDTEQLEENSTYYTREAPSVQGYNFMYWETDDYRTVQENTSQLATQDTVYRARYEAVYHDITWIYGDGTVDTEQVQEGNSYKIRKPAHKVGYEFTGWQPRIARSIVYQGEEATAYSDEVYTATYEKLKYDLTISVEDLNGYSLSRAKVEIRDDTGTRQVVKSRNNGEFIASQLEDGNYSIKTTYLNEYGTVTKNDSITINLSDNTEVEKTVAMRTAKLSDVPNPAAESNMSVYGTVNPINMIDVTIPVSMTFRIDENRVFHKPEGIKLVSRCPAPLTTKVLSINKSITAPDLVSSTKYTDYQWNNLSKQQTRSEIHLSLNGYDLSKTGGSIGNVKSAFRGPQELQLDLGSKYGKAWDNETDLTFTYNIVFEFSMP